MPRKIIRIKVVKERSGYSRSQIWRKSKNPNDDFPCAVILGPNAIGWFEHEIDQYLEHRPRGHLVQPDGLKHYQSQRAGAAP